LVPLIKPDILKDNMKEALRTGLHFGFTSGIITTLGLMVGLFSGTGSRLTVIGGILTIAIADAMSDALGIHVSEEGENVHTTREIWAATLATFFAKFICTATFLVPVLLLSLNIAIYVAIAYGLVLIVVLSWQLGRQQQRNPWPIILEHLLITLLVIMLTYFVGRFISVVCY
jgi:VIT1/CCC1 family predicted Fe2+/Mn2+ transporter